MLTTVAMSYANSILPITNNNKTKSSNTEVKILCFDLTYYNGTTQFLLCCTGVFFFYLMYGYMQELIFTLDGFKPFGWFLTLIQFAFYTFFGFFERKIETENVKRLIPLKTYALLAFLTLGTMGLSNSSLSYLNYPTQVIFKCCKLVPVLIGSILIQKKQHGPLDFLAALAMCIGLTLFTLGKIKIHLSITHNNNFCRCTVDSQISPNFDTFGVIMISTALLFDAIIGNVQEKAMREHNAPNNEVVLYSYGIGFVYLFIFMLLSGNILPGLRFCATVINVVNINLTLLLYILNCSHYSILFKRMDMLYYLAYQDILVYNSS